MRWPVRWAGSQRVSSQKTHLPAALSLLAQQIRSSLINSPPSNHLSRWTTSKKQEDELGAEAARGWGGALSSAAFAFLTKHQRNASDLK